MVMSIHINRKRPQNGQNILFEKKSNWYIVKVEIWILVPRVNVSWMHTPHGNRRRLRQDRRNVCLKKIGNLLLVFCEGQNLDTT